MRRILVLLLLSVVAGCTVSGYPMGDLPSPGPSIDLSRFTGQVLEWTKCDSFECATVKVPLDYQNPSGAVLSLHVLRNRATTDRIGTIFVNPGGPGAAGSELAARFHRGSLTGFDIVAFDPRGTGKSEPLACFDSAKADRFTAVDMSPDDESEKLALAKAHQEFGQDCQAAHPELLAHISTVDTARDLDVLRQVLGEAKVNYLGYSYGTYLGAVYGSLFGDNVGRLVLDSPVDMTDESEVIQAQGFDKALGNFARWCVSKKCGLGETEPVVLASITGLLDRLDSSPIAVGDRVLTQSLAAGGVAAALYGGDRAWPGLARAIIAAQGGDGRILLRGADVLNGRGQDGKYDALFFAFPAISCLDMRKGISPDPWKKWAEDIEKAPIFGKYFGPDLTCSAWPVPPIPKVELKPLGDKALFVAAKGDNATPYAAGVNSAKLFGSPLVTFEGEGHGTYGGASKCVDEIVQRFLKDGEVPTAGLSCPV